MGRVWLASGPDGRLVAVKQVHARFAADEGFRARFAREVVASRAVSGAYTAAVVDAGPEAEVPWLASVFVPGPSLREALDAGGPLPEAAVVRLAAGLASALVDVHRVGLVHRDLKPSNVLLAADGPRVIDFGIARAADADGGGGELTRTGWLVGSPGFASPEQAEGRELTAASDVFSLGSVLATACVGHSPFADSSTLRTLYNVVSGEPDLSALPERVRGIVAACLVKDPAARPTPAQVLEMAGPQPPSFEPWPASVHALIAAQRAEVGRITGALVDDGRTREMFAAPGPRGWVAGPAPAPVPVPPKPNRRKFLWMAGIGGAAGLAAVGGGVAVALTGNRSSPSDATAEVPPAPKGPAPTWTRPVGDTFRWLGGIDVMGDVVVRWDRKTAQAFDLATGAPRWTGKPELPDGLTSFSWIGLHGSSLIGSTTVGGPDGVVFGLGPDGKQQFTYRKGEATLRAVLDVLGGGNGDGGLSLFATQKPNGLNELVAYGPPVPGEMWRRPLKTQDRAVALIDGQHCYLQDDTDTVCLDLASGAQVWATPNTCSGDRPMSIARSGTAVAVAGDRLVLLDAATGARRPNALQTSTGIRGVGALTTMFAVGEHTETESGETRDTVWGIDPRDGSKAWETRLPLPMAGSVTASEDRVLVSTIVSSDKPPAGFLVLRGYDGGVAWAETGGGTAEWVTCATPHAIYAASSDTVYAYPNQS
ncbi:protein kinase [Amycolatopsis sp. WGS_07]